MAKLEFPNPHEVETIPGTEGWEKMYPYQYIFTTKYKEVEEYENNQFWYRDGLHYPVPIYPFDIFWDECWYLGLSQYNTRVFMVPPALGVDHRLVNGYIYISPVAVNDPKEVEKRAALFKERAGYYFDNWDELYEKWEKKMRNTISELENLQIDPLPEMEDFSVVKNAVGQSSGYHLLKKYDELIELGVLCWQYHFEFLNLTYATFVTFVDTCTKMFPDIPLQRISQMVSGLDVMIMRPDEELRKLSKQAFELGIDNVLFENKDVYKAIEELKKTDNGKKWVEAWEKAQDPWFYMSTGTGWFHTDKSWNDDLNIPYNLIKDYIKTLKDGGNIDRDLEKIRRERDNIIQEYRNLIETDEDRENFDQLLNLSQKVFPYSENHIFFVENWFHAIFWNKMREVAKIMKDHGFFEDIEDVWFMHRSEIRTALWDLVTAWATGVEPRGKYSWPEEIEWRKGVYQKFKEWTPPPAFGTAPETIDEPFTIILWGITEHSISEWAKLQKAEGSVSELGGFAGSPGKKEGIARVCKTVEDIQDLQPGEILVAPTTAPSWAPAFQKIGACVTDVGGMMSHAAIICREYSMPAVVGTGHATGFIKSGMRISVDGDEGKVEIISDS